MPSFSDSNFKNSAHELGLGVQEMLRKVDKKKRKKVKQEDSSSSPEEAEVLSLKSSKKKEDCGCVGNVKKEKSKHKQSSSEKS